MEDQSLNSAFVKPVKRDTFTCMVLKDPLPKMKTYFDIEQMKHLDLDDDIIDQDEESDTTGK